MISEKPLHEKDYLSLFHNAQVALFKTSLDGKLIAINQRYAELAGYADIADCMAQFRPGEAWADPQQRAELIRILQQKGSVRDYEAEIVRKNGEHIWILFSARILPEEDAVEGSIAEITERKRIEEELKRSEALQRKLVANIGDVIVIIDEKGVTQYKSPNVEKLFGWKPGELVGNSIFDLVHPEDMPTVQAFFDSLIQSPERVGTVQCRYKSKNDHYRWIEFICGNMLHDPDIRGILGNYHDITTRKEAEQYLRESEARFKVLHNASFGGIAIHDKGVILECNKGLAEISGFAEEELIGMDGLQLIAEESKDLVMGNILSGCEKPYEALGIRKNGETYPLRIEARNLPYKGKTVRTTEFRDISERKRAELERNKFRDQLTQAQKMESVGRLAGGVAHDFNNMLSVIMGYAEMALESAMVPSPIQGHLQEIQNAARRSMEITRQLMAFARQQTVAPKILDLNTTIESMLKMLQRLIGEDIHLAWHPQPALWPVRLDPAQVDQILANLCVNSRDAIADVGRVAITTQNIIVAKHQIDTHAGVNPGDYVQLIFSDDGCGMTGHVLENLFEPFFTTKDVNAGTGLGMATVYGIIKQNKGFINVQSEPGKGSTFKIYLPRCIEDAGAETAPEQERASPTARSNETILLVEDEPVLLAMTQEMLEKLGYSVIAANSPGEAIDMADEHKNEIRLLMTDVVMPQMNGRELAAQLVASQPNLKCLFMSGYTANVIAHHGVLNDGVQFISKPFTMNELANKVREMMDQDR